MLLSLCRRYLLLRSLPTWPCQTAASSPGSSSIYLLRPFPITFHLLTSIQFTFKYLNVKVITFTSIHLRFNVFPRSTNFKKSSFLSRSMVEKKEKKANSIDEESFSDDILKGSFAILYLSL